MNSMDRVNTAMNFQEPDRLPISFGLELQAAKEMDVSLNLFFEDPDRVAKGQLLMLEKYGFDSVTSFYYTGLEIEAWGGSVQFFEDGPPTVNRLIIESLEEISEIEPPNIQEDENIQKVLRTTKLLKDKLGDDVPIMGGVTSPFSLPIAQMGFPKFFDLIYERPKLFDQLMKKNMKFCIDYANAQFQAGATAIGYADPMSSPKMIPHNLFLKKSFKVMQNTLEQIKGDVVLNFASARCLELLKDLMKTKAVGIVPSVKEDLSKIKEKCYKNLVVIGNLNAIDMCNWTGKEVDVIIKDTIKRAAKGGGFILSDNHGEIPFQVPESVLLQIKKAVQKYGTYPIQDLRF